MHVHVNVHVIFPYYKIKDEKQRIHWMQCAGGTKTANTLKKALGFQSMHGGSHKILVKQHYIRYK